MNTDRDDPDGWVPTAGSGDPGPDPGRVSRRPARRMPNWTAATLIAGAGLVAVALIHQASPAPQTPPGGPRVTHSVPATGGPGAATTTTPRTVHGTTVVIPGGDDSGRGDDLPAPLLFPADRACVLFPRHDLSRTRRSQQTEE